MQTNATYFVTGIDTNVGKTIISAILVEALKADYWKPIQSGDLDHSDTQKVQALVSHPNSTFFEEQYRLHTPASPHYAAAVDGIEIDLNTFQLPATSNNLIVEGAGGLFVPLNSKALIIDLIEQLKLPVILVANFYLGSINHTLSSIDALKRRNIPIAGIVFNGPITESSRSYILEYSQVKELACIPKLEELSSTAIKKQAELVRNLLEEVVEKVE